jgi:hypothetical protein
MDFTSHWWLTLAGGFFLVACALLIDVIGFLHGRYSRARQR